jgi:group I intron endonuclease
MISGVKMAKKICGIYKIINTVNGHFYVGSTYDFRVHKNRHIFNLRRGKHENDHLQKAFNLYGEAAFQFILIETLEPEDDEQLWSREQHFIDQLKPAYNIAPRAGGTVGYKMTPEQLTKLKVRDEHRLPDSPETRRRKSEGLKQRWAEQEWAEEFSERFSQARKKAWMNKSDEDKQQIIQYLAQVRPRPTDEQRRKMSESHKERWKNKEITPEYRQGLSERTRTHWANLY